MEYSIKIRNISIFLSIALFVAIATSNSQYQKVPNLMLLPLTYAFSLFLNKDVFERPNMAGIIIEITMFFRYFMLPLLWSVDSNYTGVSIANNDDYCNAVYLICYELIGVSFTLKCLYKKLNIQDINSAYIKKQKHPWLIYGFLVVWFFIALSYPQFRDRLFDLSIHSREELGLAQGETLADYYNTTISGPAIVIFGFGLYLFFIQSVLFVSRLRIYKSIKIILIISICGLFVIVQTLGGMGISRWTMMISVIASAMVLYTIYPEKKNLITKVALAGGIIVVLIGSVLKLISFGISNASSGDAISFYLNSEYFDEYFCGIGPVANSMVVDRMYGHLTDGWQIIYDCFTAFPYVIKIFGLQDLTHSEGYFHMATMRTDLIMPNIGISYMQFGWLLSPLYSMILTGIALFANKCLIETSDLNKKIFYLIITFWTPLFFAVNVGQIESNCVAPIFGLLFLFFCNKL